MTNITDIFKQKAVIPFQVIGDPDVKTTVANVVAEAKAGASLVELALPFSDPVADGPAVKAANLRALDGGISIPEAFDAIAEIRAQTDVPIALVTYTNIAFVYGFEAFANKAAALNITGVIVPDMPHEEAHLFAPYLAKEGVNFITIVGPASSVRTATVVKPAVGFLTLFPALPEPLLTQELDAVHAATDLPIVINTASDDPQTIQALAQKVAGVQLTEAFVGLTDPAEVTARTIKYLTAVK
ncbi:MULTISPECIES: tryptophan synthase subunit alpha [unclassified Lacticaseibacillus]|uniref:tryptophan synthase subunit alpha n=1 Tax=unclassified Lacticaseibacillus TaxID=2759744 RepID=UPI001945869F|nr:MULTISPECIES: tryptophan synthase subunit alpha [unclassified Lacticaseibacillus]